MSDATPHSIREFIMSTPWDGKDRIGCMPDPKKPDDQGSVSWLTTYFGAPDSGYIRSIGRWWLVAAIARIMHPGCPFDYMLVFEGTQGIGKTSGLRALFEPWFREDLGSNPNEVKQLIDGMWCVELDMDSSSAAMKKLVSRTSDWYRPRYARRAQDYPRQCVFAGTTNRSDTSPLTGNRRYWPLRCTKVSVDELRADRAQLLAQALLLWQAGVRWWPTADEAVIFKQQQLLLEDRRGAAGAALAGHRRGSYPR